MLAPLLRLRVVQSLDLTRGGEKTRWAQCEIITDTSLPLDDQTRAVSGSVGWVLFSLHHQITPAPNSASVLPTPPRKKPRTETTPFGSDPVSPTPGNGTAGWRQVEKATAAKEGPDQAAEFAHVLPIHALDLRFLVEGAQVWVWEPTRELNILQQNVPGSEIAEEVRGRPHRKALLVSRFLFVL